MPLIPYFDIMDMLSPITMEPSDASQEELSVLSAALQEITSQRLSGLLLALITGLKAGNSYTLLASSSLLTPAQAGKVLGVSRSYISRLIRSGRLEAIKVGTHHRIPMKSFLQRLAGERTLANMRKSGYQGQSYLE